jgi:CRP-like cAMP-binding protein
MAILAPAPIACNPPSVKLFSRSELIPPLNGGIWRIERGAIRTVTWNQEGTPLTLGYWGVGDVVGHRLSRVQPYEIHCLTSVEASILPQELWQQALATILLHAQQTQELLSIMHYQKVSQRLWQFLIFISRKFGRDLSGGRLIDVPLTHQDIAEAINTTRVSVTRMLQHFEAEGKLRRSKRRLILFLG